MSLLAWLTLAHAMVAAGPDDICAPSDDPCFVVGTWEATDLDFGDRLVVVEGELVLSSVTAEMILVLPDGGISGTSGLIVNTEGDLTSYGTLASTDPVAPVQLHTGNLFLPGGTLEVAGNLEVLGDDVLMGAALDANVGGILADVRSWRSDGAVDMTRSARFQLTTTGDATIGDVHLLADDGLYGTLTVAGSLTMLGDWTPSPTAVQANLLVATANGLLHVRGDLALGAAVDDGAIALLTGDPILVDGQVSTGTPDTCGDGSLLLTSPGVIEIDGLLDASGRCGGALTVDGVDGVQIRGTARTDGSETAGQLFVGSTGSVRLSGSLSASGAGAGAVLVEGCDVLLAHDGVLEATGSGGIVVIDGGSSLRLDGTVHAGSSSILRWTDSAPSFGANVSMTPAATLEYDATASTCACADLDGDGVCVIDDVCPGFPDQDDVDGDGIPDGCELAWLSAPPLIAGASTSVEIDDALPGSTQFLVFGGTSGQTAVPGCAGTTLDFRVLGVADRVMVDSMGAGRFDVAVPASASGSRVTLQAVDLDNCRVSSLIRGPVQP